MDTPVDNNEHNDRSSPLEPVLLLKLDNTILAQYPLNRPRLRLGRSSECDIVLGASTGVSRVHAQVLVIDGEVVVEDLGSRNGTFVNRISRQRRTLRPGDRIAIGKYRLHFLLVPGRMDEEAPSENEIAALFKRWGRAAVTADQARCPLCDTNIELLSDSKKDEQPRIDEDGSARRTGPSGNLKSDANSAADGSLPCDQPEAGPATNDDNSSCILLVPFGASDSDKPAARMKPVVQTIDQKSVPEVAVPRPATVYGKIRFKPPSVRNKLRRKMTECRVLPAVSSGRRKKTPRKKLR